ncbi:hypothetical protein ZOD2009_06117 [Haladaptatus paucihalophilus DX253]|uniref:DUF7344 domain-containing protein n=1 Tax=Haladaptatus paucihalophilus DX253 TaxID=797209 RepID=E7QR03_HALPU|nr:hypothetical protein [Haladaptatus paucihalophilus]EFW93417.1 hypothetical protein ZOD2009_06117 [Haladaptatus paucihalophilus DX253]SHK54089.1 hypothetical protein SAMN05444342_1606 [Haladaptatus paucihalophilus DX253]
MVKPSETPPVSLSLDEIFEVLVAPRRRAVLYELHGRSEPMTLTDLAASVDAVETVVTNETNEAEVTNETNEAEVTNETNEAEVTAANRRTVAIALDHIHLPKLQQAGLVTYDRAEKTVELGQIPRQFERYLRFAAEDDHRTRAIDATV